MTTSTDTATFDLTALSGNTSIASQWTLALPGVATFYQDVVINLDTTAAALAAQIDATTLYDANYNSSSNVLTVTRSSNWASAATLTVTEVRPPKSVGDSSQAATVVTLGGSVAEGETWQINLPGVSAASYLVALNASPSLDTIAASLSTIANSRTGYESIVHNGKVLVLGSSAATTSITPPVVTGNATVSGTVDLNWIAPGDSIPTIIFRFRAWPRIILVLTSINHPLMTLVCVVPWRWR